MKKYAVLFMIALVGGSLYLLKDWETREFQEKPTSKERIVKTMYGTFKVVDPAILELMDSPVMQRIKKVQQYGILHFVKENAVDFTRYEHCVGVWALLRRYGASREEQIAGLLHDTSHTVFSHVGDFLYNHREKEKSYQDLIHDKFLVRYGVDKLVEKHGIKFEDICHEERFKRLEQSYPDLCADRIEYNLRGAFKEGLITQDDIDQILGDLHFENGKWYFENPFIARKFLSIPMYLMLNEWGNPYNYVTYTWTAHALRRAIKKGIITEEDLHFSTDDVIWKILNESQDAQIKEAVYLIKNSKTLYINVKHNQEDMVVFTKFRGLDPWMKQADGSFQRLSKINDGYFQEYDSMKKRIAQGFPIKFTTVVKSNDHRKMVMMHKV